MKSVKTWAERIDLEHSGSNAAISDDDDADYKPILQGIVNTRCTYDGGKIEGSLEE